MSSPSTIKLIGGPYEYTPPPIPRDEKLILGYNLPKKEQKWRIPQEVFKFRDMSMSQRRMFVDIERDRWVNGVYCMINGEAVYINGMYYDYLVYGTYDFGKPKFLESQRHDFLFEELTKKDRKCYGKAVLKPRRYGYTAIEIAQDIYAAMEDFNCHVGQISNENFKTKRSLFDPMMESFLKRPKYLRPNIYIPSGKKPKKELLFQGNSIKNFNADELFLDLDNYLGGWIVPATTTVTAFDGFKLKKLTADEIWKWTNVSPLEFWDIHKKCLEDGGEIIGKASLLSTMGDSEDYDMAINDAVEIWSGSDPEVRNANGFTKTGLYRYFISAVYTMRMFADEYGYIDVDRATEYILNELATKIEGTNEYIFEKRRMPLTIEDALMGADKGSIFDNVRLGKRNEEIIRLPLSERGYVKGNLELDEITKKVRFEPDVAGIWQVAMQPFRDDQRGIDTANRSRRKNGIILPPINPEGAIGYDPIMMADIDTKSGVKSQAAIVVRQKFDYYGSGYGNRFLAIAAWRPSDPDDGHRELLKACLFWGFPAMIERNCMGNCKKIFEQYKAIAYLLKSLADGIVGMYIDKTKRAVDFGVNRFQSIVKKPQSPDDPDLLAYLVFEIMIQQAMKFRKNRTNIADVFMANIECEYGLDQILETSLRSTKKTYKNFPLHAKRT